MKKQQRFVWYVMVLSLLVFCIGKPLNAQTILFSENFESYTVGQSMSGLNPGDGNSNNWITGNTALTQGSVVGSGSSTGGSGANNQVGQYFRNDNTEAAQPTLRRVFTAQTNPFEVSFKLRIDNASSDTYQLILHDITDGSKSPIRFRFSANSFTAYGSSTAPPTSTNQFETLISSGNVRTGNWYEVRIFVDPSTQTFQTSVMNLDSTDTGQSATSSLMTYFLADTHTINRFAIEQASTTSITSISIDDILITAIPEPVTAGLLGVAGTVMLLGMRRNRRR